MQIHPIRATLAVLGWLATIYMAIMQIPIAEAWWALVAGISVFYFTGTKES